MLVAAGTVVTVLAAGWGWHRAMHPAFLDQLPGESSDVGVQQALKDHGLVVPYSARSLRYSANRGYEEYPLVATFVFDCAEQEQFVESNALWRVAAWYLMLDVGAYTLAGSLGWRPSPVSAQWLERDGGGWIVTVVVQPTASGSCTAYLMASHPIEAGDGSPLGG
jgi:hypothetical protein